MNKLHNNRFVSIDAIKGISIVFIIITHSHWNQSWGYLSAMTIRNAVPLFFISIGFVYYLNFFKEIDYKKYIIAKYYRIVLPIYLLIPIILLMSQFTRAALIPFSHIPLWLIGQPVDFHWGGFFISCYVQWIAIFLVLHFFVKRKTTLICVMFSFIIFNVFFQYFRQEILHALLISDDSFYQIHLIFQHLPFIAVGILLSMAFRSKLGDHIIRFSYLYMVLFLTFCIVMIVQVKFDSRMMWHDQDSLSIRQIEILYSGLLYSFFLFIFLFLFFSILPQNWLNPILLLGKGSYEILLVQAILFWNFPSSLFHLKANSIQWFLFALFVVLVFSYSFRVLCQKIIEYLRGTLVPWWKTKTNNNSLLYKE